MNMGRQETPPRVCLQAELSFGAIQVDCLLRPIGLMPSDRRTTLAQAVMRDLRRKVLERHGLASVAPLHAGVSLRLPPACPSRLGRQRRRGERPVRRV
ncbi:MAG: hypothetical protein JNL82_19720 [Myxococcales bacterium]|nr:hypothetical protein [Myxococcales bacterium]